MAACAGRNAVTAGLKLGKLLTELKAATPHGAVSYTHLDVYKRQPLDSSTCCLSKSKSVLRAFTALRMSSPVAVSDRLSALAISLQIPSQPSSSAPAKTRSFWNYYLVREGVLTDRVN